LTIVVVDVIIFSALHAMQTRSSDYSVRVSVCLSVCQNRYLWQNERKTCPDFIPYERSFSL